MQLLSLWAIHNHHIYLHAHEQAPAAFFIYMVKSNLRAHSKEMSPSHMLSERIFSYIHLRLYTQATYCLANFHLARRAEEYKKSQEKRLRLAIKGDEANNNCVEVGCALSNAASCASWDAKRVEFQLIGCPCKELN